jgi:hypothetical protein
VIKDKLNEKAEFSQKRFSLFFDYSKMFSGHQYFSKEYYIFVLTYTLFWHTLQRTFVADSK